MGTYGYRYNGYGGGGYARKSSGGYNAATYGRRYAGRRKGWPKGKKNCNAWGRIIETEGGQGFIGGAWLYDFRRRALFRVDITPKYSRKTSGGYESVPTYYETEQGRVRYKVKCTLTNVKTFEKWYGTSIYNPDSGKIYFENLDLLININKRTACLNPFSGQYRPNYRKNNN